MPQNPGYKAQLATVLHDYIVEKVGRKEPRVSGMIFELPIKDIKSLLQDYQLFELWVDHASNLIDENRRGKVWPIPRD